MMRFMRTHAAINEGIFDPDPVRELECLCTLSFAKRQQVKRMLADVEPAPIEVILDRLVDTMMGSPSSAGTSRYIAYLGAGASGPLQEYRQELTGRVRSLENQLQELDIVAWLPQTSSLMLGEVKTCSAEAPFTSYINVSVPSLDSPFMVPDGRMRLQDQIQAILVNSVHHWRDALQTSLLLFQEVLDFVRFDLAVIRAFAFFPAIFCSVDWERRRWFLFHGPRPPKTPMQASLGLFAGACLGSILIA